MDKQKKLGFKIKVISNSYAQIINKVNIELELTASQSFILGYLYRLGGVCPCQKDIEAEFNIRHPTATGILMRLQAKDFVEFIQDEQDRRLKRIKITEDGRRAAENVGSRLEKADEMLTGGLTQEEIERLHVLLDKVAKNVIDKDIVQPFGRSDNIC